MATKATKGDLRQRARAESPLSRQMRAKGFLSVRAVLDRIHVHKSTLYRWIHNGRVKCVDLNGAYYLDWRSVVASIGHMAQVLELDPDEDLTKD